ncbi:MAG: hypothetical protein MUE44_34280 [Oscillatoriaceae cyanobacterium Prado104]|jgi:hypothetical protein|nr:hypothetical protein [Oscillatoriaceae cyanobacterium Prado104]
MSGASIPYHLRANKAIDRYAFLELLSKIDRYSRIEQYKYIGFGGHSLEDFKYIHSRFGICNMLSIEEDPDVYNRQKFNQPHSCIDCLQQPSSEFIDKFQRIQETMIWLDYVKPSELRKQIEEFQATISKLDILDIMKITVNAHPASYVPSQKGISSFKLQEDRINHLKKLLGDGDLFPSANVTEDMMTEKRFPEALCLVLKHAANLAMLGQSEIYFQPLTAFSYADGQQMLTVTGIILEQSITNDFWDTTKINKWELSNIDWKPPRRINAPNLTIKERLYIDSLLPNSEAETIQKELGFSFDSKSSESLEMLKTYVLFYRQSPYFSRIVF